MIVFSVFAASPPPSLPRSPSFFISRFKGGGVVRAVNAGDAHRAGGGEGRKEGDCSHRRECKQRKLLRVSELSRHDVSPNRGAIVRHYPPQIMEVSLSSLPPPLPMQRPGQCSVVLVSRRGDEGEERSGTGRTLHQRHLCAHTGLSSQIRTELRDRAVLPVRASCHSLAVSSSNDSNIST